MNNLINKLKLQTVPSGLICNVDSKISAVINRFQNTHSPLLAYEDDKNFMGLVTVQNTLFNRKHNSSTLIRSCLITPPKFLIDTPVGEILRIMSDLRLYTLPVFDASDKVIGLVKVKSILKGLMMNDYFSDEMIENAPKRKVLTLPEESTIGSAYQAFQKYSVSRLIVVDSKNKIKGVVTKRDIFAPYFSSTSRQRFSTRSKVKNYSFDIEQIKKDSQLLMKFVSPIFDELYEPIDISKAIKTLLASKHNSVIFVDKDRQPLSIYTTKDLLKTAVWITQKTPTLLTIISKLPQELSEDEKIKVSREIRLAAEWINKQYKIQMVRFSSKTVYNPDRKPILFEVKLKITTDSAAFFAASKDRDFMQNTKEVINQVKKQVRRMKLFSKQ